VLFPALRHFNLNDSRRGQSFVRPDPSLTM